MCDGGETTSGPGSLLMVGLELGLFAGDETGTVGLLGLAQCLPAVGPGHLTDWSLRFPLLVLVRTLSYCDHSPSETTLYRQPALSKPALSQLLRFPSRVL